jgi:hypothetical protein
MCVLLLDAKSLLVEQGSLYQGTVNRSELSAAEVFRPTIIRTCPGTHPLPQPSERCAKKRISREFQRGTL